MLSTCAPADAFSRSAPRRPLHGLGCTDACCQQQQVAWSAAVSRSLDAAGPNSWQSPASLLRSSGPPRVGFRTPEKRPATLTRSLPLTPDEFGLRRNIATEMRCVDISAGGTSASVEVATPSTGPMPAPPTVSVVDAACRLLERVVGECSDEAARPEHVFAPIFHSVSVPGISGGDYLRHHLLRLGLARKEHLAEAVVLHAFLLIDRLLHSQSANGFHLCLRNVHRVLLATTLVSAKLLDDECYNNTYWASVGGVSLPHLNQLEVEVMSHLNFSLFVNAHSLEAARQRLLSTA